MSDMKLHQAIYREPKLTPNERAARAQKRREKAIFTAGLYARLRSPFRQEHDKIVRYLFDSSHYYFERGLSLRQRICCVPGFENLTHMGGDTVYAVGYDTQAPEVVPVPWQRGENVISRLMTRGFDPRKKTFVQLNPGEEELLLPLAAFLCRGSVFCLSARGYGAEKQLEALAREAGLRLLEMAGAQELEQDFVGPFNRYFLRGMVKTPVDMVCCYCIKK